MNSVKILCLALLLWAPAASLGAQSGQLPDPVYLLTPGFSDEPGNRLPPRSLWPDLTVKKLEHTEKSPDCPDNYLRFTLYYPQGLGHPEVDRLVEKAVTERFEEDLATMRDNGFCDRDSCGALSCGAWEDNQAFAVYSPSPGYVSVFLNENSFTGGAHGNINYHSLNFNLQSGKPLTLTDLFPEPERSVPLYWTYIYKSWCLHSEYKFPLHSQDFQPCGVEDGSEGGDSYPNAEEIEDLGRLIFTPAGLSLILEPYESGSYASGTAVVDIPLEELVKMGASLSIWGR